MSIFQSSYHPRADDYASTIHVPSILSGLEAIAAPFSYIGFPAQLGDTARHEWLEAVLNNQWVDKLVSILSKLISASVS